MFDVLIRATDRWRRPAFERNSIRNTRLRSHLWRVNRRSSFPANLGRAMLASGADMKMASEISNDIDADQSSGSNIVIP